MFDDTFSCSLIGITRVAYWTSFRVDPKVEDLGKVKGSVGVIKREKVRE